MHLFDDGNVVHFQELVQWFKYKMLWTVFWFMVFCVNLQPILVSVFVWLFEKEKVWRCLNYYWPLQLASEWRHNERHGVSYHRCLDCLRNPVCLCINQRKHQSSASLAFVRGIHRWSVNSPHKGPITWKMFPFDHGIRLIPLKCSWRPHDMETLSAIQVFRDGKSPVTSWFPAQRASRSLKFSLW